MGRDWGWFGRVGVGSRLVGWEHGHLNMRESIGDTGAGNWMRYVEAGHGIWDVVRLRNGTHAGSSFSGILLGFAVSFLVLRLLFIVGVLSL